SKDGAFDANPQNPLVAMLYADLTNRMAGVEKIAPANQTRGEIPEGIQQNQATWARFTTGGTRAAVIGVVSEVWVAPFVESRWSQKDGIYNYYTPTIYDKTYSFDEPGNQNNAPSGCVATGTAQILRYFQWPQKPIGVKEGHYSIETDNGTLFENQNMNLRGGDGTGGAYNWDLMTLVPKDASMKLESIKQIGALLFDAGLSVTMGYSSTASGSNYSPSGMRKYFGYADAARSLNENDARSNLDARRPVGVSIASIIPPDLGGEGHAIVCDGYGRMDGRWYYHMNYGWAGGGDGWYNKEEVYGSTWSPSFGWAMGNLYRQKLQPHDDLGGQIISGRVTDANGNPVAGVKVSIRKKGSEDTWQTMLVWNEPKDPKATPIYQDWDEKGNNDGTQQDDEIPGADKFRNTTDANGIWAIDKVEADDYEIVLEKDGLNFAGTKAITVTDSRNVWANDFIASPLENLALESWWIEDGVVYLQFNRAVGNVNVDLSKATIGSTRLTAGEAQVIASSDIIAITGVSASGDLTLQAGFLTVDVDGSNTTDQSGMYNVKPVDVLGAVEATAAGAPAAAGKVTKIVRKNAAYTKDNLLYFTVTGNGLTDADINSFKIRNITTGKVGTQVPNASIYSWTPSTGELV
ncbi:MAG: C10 family peptidase, partial [Victivallales bacterium]|nr:C10 family peptidase [Victivallales bacterium]